MTTGPKPAPLFYEMLRSFSTLAEELNLSRTVEAMGNTRQTVRRHIEALEELRGVKLFDLDADRRYCLTAEGDKALGSAREIIALCDLWASSSSAQVGGLPCINIRPPSGLLYLMQAHPLSRIWQDGSELLRTAFRAWSLSEGLIEAEEMEQVRHHALVFRKLHGQWVVVEVGQNSSFATWFGWERARSTVGLPLDDFPGEAEYDALLNKPYEDVLDNGFGRLDHILTETNHEKGGKPDALCYQRLLLACRFPDESRGVMCFVTRTRNVEIAGMSEEERFRMPEKYLME